MKLNAHLFIERSSKIHNNAYDYNKVNYINNDTKVIIICKVHGDFEQSPKSHLEGHGCFKCKNRFPTTQEFIEKCKVIHGDKYSYENTVFNGMNNMVTITCKVHGDFEQIAKSHLKGHHCSKCYKEKISKNDILLRLKTIHNQEYEYDDFEYNKRMSEIYLNIKCKKHGVFKQRLSNHIHQGNGCPYCKRSKGEEQLNEFFIKNNIVFEREKTFDECKNIKKLQFDFYLPDFNTCVEYDGVQHYKPSFGEKQFLYLKNNDNIKNDFCLEKNINLIRIKYDENPIEKISQYLNI